MSNTAGYLDGVILDRSPEEIEAALEDAENLDMDAEAKYLVLYDRLFSMEYPYVQKLKKLSEGPLQNSWKSSRILLHLSHLLPK